MRFCLFSGQALLAPRLTYNAIIVLFGGIFILYTAMKEILHMMTLEEMNGEERKSQTCMVCCNVDSNHERGVLV